ncbi:[Fe-Fe] hydrogenase large subunit C-terminal domain-containing protein [Saccharicrinis aurantiacus]|uniref:[Fe-Fe] hydrogenase large subunit C-terminal domain-containing protein n=1 Tax=Saccharicrinis aurantiacus TaxID=1849719 RepID=UPI0024934AD1|nr:[Fe-Fe] hydrogenase large subunit C-terminal domain-containing protein [Saccharicrinis aurantiacus]
MNEQYTYHAIKVDHNVCYGCTHCMHVCPTNSIRVNNGKAHILIDKCIDCGECLKNCPVNAIYVDQDDFSNIYEYKYRVALVPAVLTGQFPTNISEEEIFGEMNKLGFTHVYHAEDMAPVIKELINYQISEDTDKPLISTFCPAVVRLIQVKFPLLLPHLVDTLPPIDASAIYYRKLLVEEGIPENEIGIFYITPCAAKIASIKNNLSSSNSNINGVINMSFLYNRIYGAIKNNNSCTTKNPLLSELTQDSIKWSLSRGELSQIDGTGLAVDEINNVIEFLELLENGEVPELDFLELRTCDQGCAGGALLQGNRFLTVERIKTRVKKLKINSFQESYWDKCKDVFNNKACLKYEVKEAKPAVLDKDFSKALKKMERIRDLMCFLPGIDCGACGSPSCQTLAEDIVQGHSNLSNCVFLQRMMEKKRKLHSDHAIRIIEGTWGKDRLDKDCKKKGAKNEDI